MDNVPEWYNKEEPWNQLPSRYGGMGPEDAVLTERQEILVQPAYCCEGEFEYSAGEFSDGESEQMENTAEDSVPEYAEYEMSPYVPPYQMSGLREQRFLPSMNSFSRREPDGDARLWERIYTNAKINRRQPQLEYSAHGSWLDTLKDTASALWDAHKDKVREKLMSAAKKGVKKAVVRLAQRLPKGKAVAKKRPPVRKGKLTKGKTGKR